MVITCPACKGRDKIDPAASKSKVGKAKCPGCSHVFAIALAGNDGKEPAKTVPAVRLGLIVDDARYFLQMIKQLLALFRLNSFLRPMATRPGRR